MLEARPETLAIRLDWLEAGVTATVRGRARGAPQAPDEAARAAVAAARRDKQMPQMLATMIHEQETTAARGLSERGWNEIRERARLVGDRRVAFERRLGAGGEVQPGLIRPDLFVGSWGRYAHQCV